MSEVNFPGWKFHGHHHQHHGNAGWGEHNPRQLYNGGNPRPVSASVDPPGGGGGGGGTGQGGVNLAHFKLQLPTGSKGNVDEIGQGQLGFYNSEYFQRHGGAIRFTIPQGGGATTENSKFPRSELSEEKTWRMGDGTSTLMGNLTIDKLPPNGSIVIGQIHQKGGENGAARPPVELIYRNGDLILSVLDTNSPNGARKEIKIAENVGVGEAFSYSLKLNADGTLTASAAGNTVTVKLDQSFANSELYFKAGNYTQDPAGGSSVTFYDLNITHE